MAISINPMALLGDEAVRAKQAVMAALEEETGDTSAETSSGSKSGTTSFAATFTSAMDDVNEYLEDPADEAIIEATSANASGSLGDIGIFTVDARTIPLLDGVYTGTIEDDELKYEFTGVQKDIFRLLRFLVTTHETDGTITDIDEAMAALGWDEVTDEHEAADTVIDFYRSLDYTNLGVTYDVLYDYTDQLFEDVFDNVEMPILMDEDLFTADELTALADSGMVQGPITLPLLMSSDPGLGLSESDAEDLIAELKSKGVIDSEGIVLSTTISGSLDVLNSSQKSDLEDILEDVQDVRILSSEAMAAGPAAWAEMYPDVSENAMSIVTRLQFLEQDAVISEVMELMGYVDQLQLTSETELELLMLTGLGNSAHKARKKHAQEQKEAKLEDEKMLAEHLQQMIKSAKELDMMAKRAQQKKRQEEKQR